MVSIVPNKDGSRQTLRQYKNFDKRMRRRLIFTLEVMTPLIITGSRLQVCICAVETKVPLTVTVLLRKIKKPISGRMRREQ